MARGESPQAASRGTAVANAARMIALGKRNSLASLRLRTRERIAALRVRLRATHGGVKLIESLRSVMSAHLLLAGVSHICYAGHGMWSVFLYRSPGGREPVADFIRQLPAKLGAKVARDLDLLNEFGIRLGEPKVAKLSGTSPAIWELRTRLGSDQVRILFGSLGRSRLVLLYGFAKKSRTTPKPESTEGQGWTA